MVSFIDMTNLFIDSVVVYLKKSIINTFNSHDTISVEMAVRNNYNIKNMTRAYEIILKFGDNYKHIIISQDNNLFYIYTPFINTSSTFDSIPKLKKSNKFIEIDSKNIAQDLHNELIKGIIL